MWAILILSLLIALEYREGVFGASAFATKLTQETHKAMRSQQQELLLLPRKIRGSRTNITACLELLRKIPRQEEGQRDPMFSPMLLQQIYLEALQVLHKQRSNDKQDLAFQFYKNCPTESVRAKAISVCGGHQFNASLWLRGQPGVASINAALAALARAQKWDQSQDWLLQFAPHLSTFSYNIVLMGMERANQGTAALALLQNMTQYGPTPDRGSYHHTMGALGRNHENDAAYTLLDGMRLSGVPPNNATFDILARAYGRTGDWTMVGLVDSLRQVNLWGESFPDPAVCRKQAEPSRQRHVWRWENNAQGLKQVGSGRDAFWEFATIGEFSVALQPHRNPTKNGMKILLFLRDDNERLRKVGFLLMINSRPENSSTMLGIFIHPDFRRLGLSKTILAIWLDLLDRAGLSAKTGVINKPLLALILQHTFGFTPRRHEGVEVEVLPSTKGTVDLHAPSLKSLEGVFGAREMERQKIQIVVGTPSVPGKRCQVKTAFTLETLATVQANQQLAKMGNLKYRSVDTPWRNVLLGCTVREDVTGSFQPVLKKEGPYTLRMMCRMQQQYYFHQSCEGEKIGDSVDTRK